MNRFRHLIILSLLIVSIFDLNGQDIHYSQFHMSPLNVNPALSGVINGDQRFLANIRDQWESIPVPYLSVSGSYDMRFSNYKYPNGFFGGGFLFNYDKAGDSKLSLAQIGLNGTYSHILTQRNIVTIGVGAAVNQRRFNEEDLRWERQWNGDIFDPSINSGELFETTGLLFLDLNAGLNFRHQRDGRNWINVGAGAFHLTQPDQTYYSLTQSNDTRLPIRIAGVLQSSLKVLDDVDLMINGLYQLQGPYGEAVANLIGRLYISNKPGRHYILDVGLGYRLDDSVYPLVGFQYNNWYFSASYDVNISDFAQATQGRGGPELALRYIFARPAPPLEFKKCPVY